MIDYVDTWKKLHAACHGKLKDWLAEKDEQHLLAAFRSVWGDGATFDTYAQFVRSWHAAKEAGERLAELIVVYGPGVAMLPAETQEQLRLAIPYARGCKAAIAAECATASNGRDVPGIETCRALTNRDQKEAERLRLTVLANKMVTR